MICKFYYIIRCILKCHRKGIKWLKVWLHKFIIVSFDFLLFNKSQIIYLGRALPNSPPHISNGIKKILLNDDALNRAFDECNNDDSEI